MDQSPRPDGRITFVCSCEDTMHPDGRVLARACAARPGELGEVRGAEQLCRSQLERFRAALGGRPVTVGCTQEAPLFSQEAEAAGHAGGLTFVNIRETAGWSAEGEAATPKMAALLAAAALPLPETPLVPLKSDGVTLVLGRDGAALAAAERLKDRLDLTVLLTGGEDVTPPRVADYPVLRGRARAATGHLGAFAVTVDGFAAPSPSSRDRYRWGVSRDGAVSRCDVILDLTGGPALFPVPEVRWGYLRADPADAVAVERAVTAAGELVGEFDKPRFVTYDAGLCAHARNRRVGCNRCLDLCPTGAITEALTAGGARADFVAVATEVCAGCGACAAVCPTGAITYALPTPDAILGRLRTLLLTYRDAGGVAPVLLLHDAEHGEPVLDALARHGDGLPARVLPLRVATGAADLSPLLAAFAWGAAAVRVLLPGRRGHGADGVLRNLDYAEDMLRGLGVGGDVPLFGAVETDDPFSLGEALTGLPEQAVLATPATFLPLGKPREVALLAARAIAAGLPAAPEVVPLPAGAPFGQARVMVDGCTLCLACTMVCPTAALSANPDRPQLSFLEDACVQCGLCASTCPERVIELVPRLNLSAAAGAPAVVKEEAPATCPRCAKAFGTQSSIERVVGRLRSAGHWAAAAPERERLLRLCEDCRVVEATESRLDPYAGAERAMVVTTMDYLAARDAAATKG